MASGLYANYRNLLLGGGSHTLPDLNDDTIMVALRDEGTTAVNLATHQDLADISAAVVDAEQVGSPTVGVVGAGVFDHADVTFEGVSGNSVESLDYYMDSGSASTSPLICNIDDATGLPVTPNGGDIVWTPDAAGVFAIGQG